MSFKRIYLSILWLCNLHHSTYDVTRIKSIQPSSLIISLVTILLAWNIVCLCGMMVIYQLCWRRVTSYSNIYLHVKGVTQDTGWVFARHMFQGKVKAALCFLSDQSHGCFLPISVSVGDSTVLEESVKKQPCPLPATPASLIVTDVTNYTNCHSVILNNSMSMSYAKLHFTWVVLVDRLG